MSSSTAAATTTYWCYRCSCFVRVWARDAVVCPTCDGGFLEAMETPSSGTRHRRFPATAAQTVNNTASDTRFRRNRRPSAGDRSVFNPVIVLRSPSDHSAPRSFELYYDDGEGAGLRPLPSIMSEFLMGSGFERILDQLSQIGINGAGAAATYEQPPASKSAIESMPIIMIAAGHIKTDSHCAVCKESFELNTEAREMPCKHIYHQNCIFPWLSIHNSCPVCRHEMPPDLSRRGGPELAGDELAPADASEEDAIGLTIWRLPGGGFAIGRFSGGRGVGERELPVVYTEMDGGFNARAASRSVSWPRGGSRSTESRGIGGAFRNFFSFFGCFGASAPSSSWVESMPTSSRGNWRGPIARRRHRRSWALRDGNGSEIARW